jgi:hypothetical protein
MRADSVSLCMIVRDEAGLLPGFLERVAGAWDELCAVDTGSRDETPELLSRAGARVERRAWPGDFALARNWSLDLARGDWILVLDPDEWAAPGFAEALRAARTDPRCGAASLVIHNRLPHGRLHRASLLRLFRRDLGARYQHAIHEDIGASVMAGLARTGRGLRHLACALDHLGYVRDRAAARDKKARDAGLLASRLRADPSDLYSHFKRLELARFWGDRGLWAEAAGAAGAILEGRAGAGLGDLPFGGELAVLTADGLFPGDPRGAAAWLDSLACRPEGSLPYRLRRAELSELLGQAEHARAGFEACLGLDCWRDPDLGRVRPRLGLARLHLAAGRLPAAAAQTDQALAANPRDPEALLAALALARLRRGAEGVVETAARLCALHGDSTELHLALADEALAAGQPERAVRELELLPPELRGELGEQRLAQARLASGDLEGARQLATGLAARLPEAAMGLLTCDLVQGRDSRLPDLELDWPVAERALRAWFEAVARSPHGWLKIGLRRHAPAAAALFPWTPEFVRRRL